MIAEALTFAPVDLVLRDGETVRVRPVQPDDEPRLVAFLEDLPAEARAFRFFSGGLSMRRAARYAMSQLDAGGFGLVAVAGEPSVVVAHAMCSRPTYGAAEVAFAVAGDWQGRGLATLLLAHVAAEARVRGIETFTAIVLPAAHVVEAAGACGRAGAVPRGDIRVLAGYRGAPGADLRAVADVLQRLAAMAAAHSEIREVDANPVLAHPDGAVILDLRVRIAPAVRRPWAPSVQESTR